jgi:hypothetical protein
MKVNINEFSQDDDIISFLTSTPPVFSHGSHRSVAKGGTSLNTNFLGGKTTLFPKEFSCLLHQALAKGDLTHVLSDSGMPCRVMRGGQPWQKGKIVISVNFVPDPPDEPLQTDVLNELDELRK